MGKLILCTGESTTKAFKFQLTNTNVYSLEELCYYIYENPYILLDEMFGETLVNWIEEELKLPDTAKKLNTLLENESSIKDKVVTILCASDYYTESQIKQLIRVLDELSGLQPIQCRKRRADNYMKYRKYLQGEKEYEKIIAQKEAVMLTNKELGEIYHNLALIKLHTTSFRAAAEKFKEAYEYSRNGETLKAYIFVLTLGKMDEELRNVVNEYNLLPEYLLELNAILETALLNSEQSKEYKRITNFEMKKIDGKVSEYYKEMDCLLEEWKKKYRQALER